MLAVAAVELMAIVVLLVLVGLAVEALVQTQIVQQLQEPLELR
jgi:hypothetical protein